MIFHRVILFHDFSSCHNTSEYFRIFNNFPKNMFSLFILCQHISPYFIQCRFQLLSRKHDAFFFLLNNNPSPSEPSRELEGLAQGKGAGKTLRFVHVELRTHSIFNHAREREKHSICNHAGEREFKKQSMWEKTFATWSVEDAWWVSSSTFVAL